MDKIQRKDLYLMFQSIADIMSEKEKELCEMDAKLGDGDLGLTMKKGFGFLPSYIETLDEENISKVISKCGMKMTSIIPSTMGFLMGSGLLEAGKMIKEFDCIDAKVYVLFLQGFVNGIAKRGNCSVGDRTVLDSIERAFRYSKKALNDNEDISLEEIVKTSKIGALKGLEDTKDMEPKFGKAAVHKKDCVGIVDQGAKAGMYLISAINEFVSEN